MNGVRYRDLDTAFRATQGLPPRAILFVSTDDSYDFAVFGHKESILPKKNYNEYSPTSRYASTQIMITTSGSPALTKSRNWYRAALMMRRLV